MVLLDNLRIVLTEPSHPGNIGAAARAMKAMGLTTLYLVQPKQFPHVEATARASGADDVLAGAVVVERLADALVGCHQVYASSARIRSLTWPLCSPREFAVEAVTLVKQQQTIALVFGREHSGLTNDELALCQKQVHIPSKEDFSSLNLAQAVQVLAYEIRLASLEEKNQPVARMPVAHDELEMFYQHLQETLIAIDFLDPKQPKMLMQRLRRLFGRATLDQREINILRGILAAIGKHTVS